MRFVRAEQVFPLLQRSILADGYSVIMDLEKSRGARFVDAASGRTWIDFFSFFASNPIGYNHPRMSEPEFERHLLKVAKLKISNSDVYSTYMAEFVNYFHDHFAPQFDKLFFIEGGALAVENAIKTAQDWKVRLNLKKGKRGVGGQVLHFQHAFHGRTGYTLTLTNTVPDKTDYFPKFDWPRVSTPEMRFPLTPESIKDLRLRESESIQQIHRAFDERKDEICAIVLETIQSEGGDNHFSREFLQELKKISLERECLLIFDEVQAGMGITGKTWAFEHFDVLPDIIAFGKKVQVCGIAVRLERLQEVDHVFKVPSRINSTWGGNIVDMVRSHQYMRIIKEENLLQHVSQLGEKMLSEFVKLSHEDERVTNARGRGFLMAFDMPTPDQRDRLIDKLWDQGLLILKSGKRTIRVRPVLDLKEDEAMEGLQILRKTLKEFR
jgi:L-lysine 6-transaminase